MVKLYTAGDFSLISFTSTLESVAFSNSAAMRGILFLDIEYPEVVLPAGVPAPGIPGAARVDPRRATMSA